MEFELTQIASLGLGAVIAVIVLNWKRTDDKNYSDSLKTLTDQSDSRLTVMIDALNANTQALNVLREELSNRAEIQKMMSDMESRILKYVNLEEKTDG